MEKIKQLVLQWRIIWKPLDETEDQKHYDIEFTWEPERAGVVDDFLNRLGIKIERAVRDMMCSLFINNKIDEHL